MLTWGGGNFGSGKSSENKRRPREAPPFSASFWLKRAHSVDVATNGRLIRHFCRVWIWAFFPLLLPFRYVSKKSFPGDIFPDYMQGATYFGTTQAVRAVMAHTSEVVGFNMDDLLYTGILAERAKPPVFRFNSGTVHFRGEQKVRSKGLKFNSNLWHYVSSHSDLATEGIL